MSPKSARIIVLGAGAGGLTAAVELAARGLEVVLVERASGPGGKMRALEVGGVAIEAGPTVFTLRPILEEIFTSAGAELGQEVRLEPATILARHAWGPGEQLDLFADPARSADAIGAFAGAEEARRFLAFRAEAARIWKLLEQPFLRTAAPSLAGLLGGVGIRGLAMLPRIRPFESLWTVLGGHFRDPRLQQLFARYATYCGGSPFLAPATLMLVAHAELSGMWRIEGGFSALARALARLAERKGVRLRFGCEARRLLVKDGRIAGVLLADGERIDAAAVVVNADIAAVAAGRFGPEAARAVVASAPAGRSLSALVWILLGTARTFPLLHHTVFFSTDYRAEFRRILDERRLPADPTVYVCAQDRPADEAPAPLGVERLLCLVNAPPTGDQDPFPTAEIDACASRTFARLERSGLRIETEAVRIISPTDFEAAFPATGGALYGPAPHGWRAAFARQGVRSKLPGLYLAGGSVHPGPGVPMAALSGRLAAHCLLADLASPTRSRRTAMLGGILTR